MEAKHSPLPWEVVEGLEFDEWGIRRVGEETGMSVAQMLWDYDAEYIVKAVNHHDGLVAALAAMVKHSLRGHECCCAAHEAARALLTKVKDEG